LNQQTSTTLHIIAIAVIGVVVVVVVDAIVAIRFIVSEEEPFAVARSIVTVIQPFVCF
jgi:hypothetical protein